MAYARADQFKQTVCLGCHRYWVAKGKKVAQANDFLEPGMLVRHPDRPDWGLGQVQANIPGRVTVTFENAGKIVLDSKLVTLVLDGVN